MKNDPSYWIEKKILKLSMYDAHNNVFCKKIVINKDVLFKFKGAFDRGTLLREMLCGQYVS